MVKGCGPIAGGQVDQDVVLLIGQQAPRFGEEDIFADHDTDAPDLGVNRIEAFTRLTEAHLFNRQVDLLLPSDDLPVRPEDEANVFAVGLFADAQIKTTGDNGHLEFKCRRAEKVYIGLVERFGGVV